MQEFISNRVDIETKYELRGILGSGGYATVYEAIERSTTNHYAVKRFDTESLSTRDLNNIRLEIQTMSKIQHDNIIFLKESFEFSNRLYIVMELGAKTTLFDHISRVTYFPERDAAAIMEMIVSAVAYLHHNKIVHRDLKPENILYEPNADMRHRLKLTDFGFAREMKNDGLQTSCGSPFYISPEVLEGKPYNEKVDCWALGVILYILLSGCPPFYHRMHARLFRKIRMGEYTFPPQPFDSVSEDAKELISKCLVVDPTKRFGITEIQHHKWFDIQRNILAPITEVFRPQPTKTIHKFIDKKSKEFKCEGYLLKEKNGIIGKSTYSRYFILTPHYLRISESQSSKSYKEFLLSRNLLNVEVFPKQMCFFLKLTNKAGSVKSYTLTAKETGDFLKWNAAIQRVLITWELITRSQKAFKSTRYQTGLILMSEFRQIPEMTHNIDVLNSMRAFGLNRINKVACPFIWNIKTEHVPKYTITFFTVVDFESREYLFCGTKEGYILCYDTRSRAINTFKAGSNKAITCVYFHLQPYSAITGHVDGTTCFYHIFHSESTGEEATGDLELKPYLCQKSRTNAPITSIAGSTKSLVPTVATIGNDSVIHLFQATTASEFCLKVDQPDPLSRTVLIIKFYRNFLLVPFHNVLTAINTDDILPRPVLEPIAEDTHTGMITGLTVFEDRRLVVTVDNSLRFAFWYSNSQSMLPMTFAEFGFTSTLFDLPAGISHESQILSIGFLKSFASEKTWLYSLDEEGRIVIWKITLEEFGGKVDGVSAELEATRHLQHTDIIRNRNIVSTDGYRAFIATSHNIDVWAVEWVLEYKNKEYLPPVSLLYDIEKETVLELTPVAGVK